MIKANSLNTQNTISFNTLGCRLNQSETASIARTFEQKGYQIVDFDQPADIVVINTCTVTENSDFETRRLVQKANKLNPKVHIALIGCQAQIQKEKLLQLPNVRWVVGNAIKMDLANILTENKTEEPQVLTPAIPRGTFTVPEAAIDPHHTRGTIKIQDGCDFFCTFCEIPFARGRARSREFNDILKEVKTLSEAGRKEIVITGINVGTFREGKYTFLDVIDAIEQIETVKRIRISSIEPTTIPINLIKRMGGKSKLCRYLHIPLQSGDDEILSLMKRKYTREEFRDFILNAYNTVPEICIGTDVIVGFPGETEQHFLNTEEFIRENPIHYFHVFSYSDRSFNPSRKFEGGIRPQIIKKRSEILRELSQRKRQAYFASLIGTIQTVLAEHKEGEYWSGLTDNYVRVLFQSDKNLKNQLVSIKLELIKETACLGKIDITPETSENSINISKNTSRH